MDYKEEYQKALERAKKGLPLDEVFPELKESEDERIRKELIEYLTHRAEVTAFVDETKDCERWISYLEKQKEYVSNNFDEVWEREDCSEIIAKGKKLTPEFEALFKKVCHAFFDKGVELTIKQEQKPLMCDGEIEDRKRDIVAAIRKYYSADYAEYLTSFLKGLSPEDNSDDEYGQEMLGIAYKLMYEHIPENLRTQEFWDSLKFMREYTGRVAIIHSYQQPAEWSEEDEYKVDDICKLIEHATIIPRSGDDDTGIPPTRLNDKYKGELKAFVKSLRPQPKAEWSEEDEKMMNP